MKKTLLILLTIFSLISVAQGDYNNMRKYWYYKTRLNNCFTKVGLERGESMPFNQRGAFSTYFSGGNYTKSLLLGDGTSTLGEYIGMLATEYYLLKSNGQRTDSVRHELFCALNAFNRCDVLAEGTNASNANNYTALNGFFIRDDIKADFVLKNYDHFNYYNNWSGHFFGDGNWDSQNAQPATINSDRGFASLLPKGQQYTESTFQSFELKLNDPNNSSFPIYNHLDISNNNQIDYATTFESQDQVYNLLLGLALASKFVDENAIDIDENGNARVFPYEGQGVMSLQKEARNIADRIIQHIRNDNEWRIKYPGTNQTVFGGNAGSFAYPLAESGCFISGNGELPAHNAFAAFNSPKGCGGIFDGDSYHTWYSATQLNFEWWNSLAKSVAPKMDQAVFLANLSAVSDGIFGVSGGQWVSQLTQQWIQSPSPILNVLGHIVQFIWNLVTIVVNIFLDWDFDNSTGTGMTDNAYFWGLDYAPVARAILHPDVGNYVANWDHTMDYLLDVAPCDGTRNFGNPNEGHYEWSSDSRCDHPNRRGTDPHGDLYNPNTEDTWPGGEFNGIDYMLYHNLWAIYKKQQNGSYYMQDFSDQYINRNGGPITTSSFNAFAVEGFETITMENTVVPNNKTGYFRAGKTIQLKPGSYIPGSNNVHLYIDPFNCATGDIASGKIAGTNTETFTPETFHHVEYAAEPISIRNEVTKNPIDPLISNTATYTNPKEPDAIYKDSVMNAFILAYVTGDQIVVSNSMESSIVKVYFNLGTDAFANMVVVDMKGQKVFEANNLTQKNNGLSINMESFASGMYMLKFIRSNGKVESKKLYKI